MLREPSTLDPKSATLKQRGSTSVTQVLDPGGGGAAGDENGSSGSNGEKGSKGGREYRLVIAYEVRGELGGGGGLCRGLGLQLSLEPLDAVRALVKRVNSAAPGATTARWSFRFFRFFEPPI